jgi:uncharacterized caspase-like protein
VRLIHLARPGPGRWLLGLVLLAAVGQAVHAAGAEPGPRVALVIGNAAYRNAPLSNPGNDAKAMAQQLEQLGFHVIRVQDGTQQQMFQAVRSFGDALRGGVGLFYFAGHGVQVKGRNFLIPVDAQIEREDEVPYKALDVGLVLEKMEAARNPLNIVILDACRNNPFARGLRSAGSGGGLAQMDAPSGSLVAFATAPGATAEDGRGANGLYTSHLLRQMAVPGLPIEEVFKRTRVAVKQESGGRQIPWESTSLEGAFFFAGAAGGAAPTGAAGQRGLSEKELWDVIAGAGTASGYRAYLEKYPQGAYADQAQARLAAATATSSTRTPEAERPGSRPPPPGTPAAPGAGFSFSAAEAQLDRQSSAGRVSAARRALADMPCPPERRRARVQLQVGESSRGAILGPALAAFLREAGVRVVSQGTSEYRVRGSASTQVGLDWSTGLQQVSITSVLELAGPRGPLLPNRVARDETYAGRDVQAAMDELVLRHAGEWAPQIFEAICNR